MEVLAVPTCLCAKCGNHLFFETDLRSMVRTRKIEAYCPTHNCDMHLVTILIPIPTITAEVKLAS